jgi:DNA-directed RNA polymerase specialized sigma24 family protein
MRTWAYALARNAMRRYASAPARRAERNQPLSLPGITSRFALEARSVTRMYQRTAEKDRFRALREKLDGDDQMLLILRVDRNLEWRDLAIAMSGDLDCDDETIVRESARLRKAFERLKRELRRLAVAEGLLEPRD